METAVTIEFVLAAFWRGLRGSHLMRGANVIFDRLAGAQASTRRLVWNDRPLKGQVGESSLSRSRGADS